MEMVVPNIFNYCDYGDIVKLVNLFSFINMLEKKISGRETLEKSINMQKIILKILN